MSQVELKEAFHLICNLDQLLAYHHWIEQRYPHLKVFFAAFASSTHRDTISLREETQPDISITEQSQQLSVAQTNLKYLAAKQKIEQYITSQELNIGMMFAIMDTNSSSEITYAELRQKMRAMHIQLDEDEC